MVSPREKSYSPCSERKNFVSRGKSGTRDFSKSNNLNENSLNKKQMREYDAFKTSTKISTSTIT